MDADAQEMREHVHTATRAYVHPDALDWGITCFLGRRLGARMLIQIMLSINRGQRDGVLLGTDDFDCLAHVTLALTRDLANDYERELEYIK